MLPDSNILVTLAGSALGWVARLMARHRHGKHTKIICIAEETLKHEVKEAIKEEDVIEPKPKENIKGDDGRIRSAWPVKKSRYKYKNKYLY